MLMGAMNISPPNTMKASAGDCQHLRNLVLEGAHSPAGKVADDAYFRELRKRIDRPAQ